MTCQSHFAYDALSRRTSLTLSNGTQTSYSYDAASQVQNILHKITATNTPINNADYLYNNVGNRTQLTDKRGPQAFGYDTLDRLTSATHPLPPTSQTFAYDPVGNRTSNGSLSNAGNQLTEDATFTYLYDDNGNQTRKTNKATNNFTVYIYDAENRLTKVEDYLPGNPTPTTTSTYRYDGLGRRIEKVTPTGTRRYIYDGEDILLEYDGSNVLQARYTHGPGIDEAIAVTKGSNTFFYHQDGLGSVTDLTDSAGATAKSYSYDAYGNIIESPGTVDQPYTYTGREFDSESGLYAYRIRDYDAQTGRFLEEDPIGMKGGLNFYTYARNNPLRFNDPLGLCACPGGVWDQEIGDSQVSIGFGAYFSVGRVNYTCRSKPSLKCRGRQTCFGGGPIATVGLSWNLVGAARGAGDSNNLGGWSSLSMTVAAGPIGVQAPLPPDSGGNVSAGPGIGGGAALIRCYTDYLRCNCSCSE